MDFTVRCEGIWLSELFSDFWARQSADVVRVPGSKVNYARWSSHSLKYSTGVVNWWSQIPQFSKVTWIRTFKFALSTYGHELVSQARPLPQAAFSSFRINTRREGLGDCLYQFGSRLCNIYVTSCVGGPPIRSCQKLKARHLAFFFPFRRAKSLLYGRLLYGRLLEIIQSY